MTMQHGMSCIADCPHCGAAGRIGDSGTAEVTTSREMGYDDDNESEEYCVVCNANRHGCGATGGYRSTPAEAIAAWNTRVMKKLSWRDLLREKLGLDRPEQI